MSLDHASAGDLLERFARARCTWDGNAWVDLFTPDAESHDEPFGDPLVGHNALRANLLAASEFEEQVEFTFERHWVVPPTILAAWHAGYVHRHTRARVRVAGFVTLEIADDGRIRKARFWCNRQESPAKQGGNGGSMAGDVSFDVVSEFDVQELRNALDQVRREVAQRYDFKGATVDLVQSPTELTLVTDDEFRAGAVKDLIESKAVRRNLSLKIFDWGKIEPAGGNKVRQRVGLRRGLSEDLARKLSKLIRDEFPKVKSQIQGDAIRVSGKSKDDLQRVIARLRELDEPVPLQFQNYR